MWLWREGVGDDVAMDESKEAVSPMSEERQNSDQGGESMHLLQSISAAVRNNTAQLWGQSFYPCKPDDKISPEVFAKIPKPWSVNIPSKS